MVLLSKLLFLTPVAEVVPSSASVALLIKQMDPVTALGWAFHVVFRTKPFSLIEPTVTFGFLRAMMCFTEAGERHS